MTEPRTAAGRALSGPGGYMIKSDVLAIEAQAATLDVDVLRASFRRRVQASISNEAADRMGRLLDWAIEDARAILAEEVGRE